MSSPRSQSASAPSLRVPSTTSTTSRSRPRGVVARGEADLRDIGQVVLHLPHRLSPRAARPRQRTRRGRSPVGRRRAHWRSRARCRRGAAGRPALGRALGPRRLSRRRARPRRAAPVDLGRERTRCRRRGARGDADHRGRGRARPPAAPHRRRRIARGSRMPGCSTRSSPSASIPMHGPSVRSLAQSVTGRTLLGALALADDDFGRASVIRWMSAAPLRANGERLRPARWARVALRAGVVRGPEQWTDRLGQRATELDATRPLLAEYVAWLVAECGVDERESWAAWADWARMFMSRVLGSPAARRRWPEAELSRVRRGRAGGRRPPVPRRDRARADQPPRGREPSRGDAGDACGASGSFGARSALRAAAPCRGRRPRRSHRPRDGRG